MALYSSPMALQELLALNLQAYLKMQPGEQLIRQHG
jgi:hypothetical protein